MTAPSVNVLMRFVAIRNELRKSANMKTRAEPDVTSTAALRNLAELLTQLEEEAMFYVKSSAGESMYVLANSALEAIARFVEHAMDLCEDADFYEGMSDEEKREFKDGQVDVVEVKRVCGPERVLTAR